MSVPFSAVALRPGTIVICLWINGPFCEKNSYESSLMEESCQVCSNVKDVVDKKTAERILTFDMDTYLVYGTGKHLKQGRKELLRTFLNHVCALRNSGGGLLLIHFTGRGDNESHDLHAFSELVDVKLNAMIEDNTLFVDNYERSWLQECSHVLVLKVKSSSTCSTSDFKTKIPLDCSLVDPTARNIPKLYTVSAEEKLGSIKESSEIDWSEEFVPLFENRHIQLKSFGVGVDIPPNIEGKAQLIWETLKLRENITAMTKVLDGGSYFCGIEEVSHSVGAYQIKKSKVHGMTLPSDERYELRDALLLKVRQDMMWTTKTNNVTTPSNDVIDIVFHEVREGTFVMEVIVQFFEGLVFYDRLGPECYVADDNPVTGEWCLQRVLFSDWIARIRSESGST